MSLHLFNDCMSFDLELYKLQIFGGVKLFIISRIFDRFVQSLVSHGCSVSTFFLVITIVTDVFLGHHNRDRGVGRMLNTTFKWSETWFEIVDSILERVQHAQYSLLYINTGGSIQATSLMTCS